MLPSTKRSSIKAITYRVAIVIHDDYRDAFTGLPSERHAIVTKRSESRHAKSAANGLRA